MAEHQRSASWFEAARISWLAVDLAERHSWVLDTESGRWEMHVLAASGVVDYERPILSALYERCRHEVALRQWADPVSW